MSEDVGFVDGVQEHNAKPVSYWGYAILTFLVAFVGVPVLTQLAMALAGAIVFRLSFEPGLVFCLILYFVVPFQLGKLYGTRKRLPPGAGWRYGPVLVAAYYVLLVMAVALVLVHSGWFDGSLVFARTVLWGLLPFGGLISFSLEYGSWIVPLICGGVVRMFLLGFLKGGKRNRYDVVFCSVKKRWLLLWWMLLLLLLVGHVFLGHQSVMVSFEERSLARVGELYDGMEENRLRVYSGESYMVRGGSSYWPVRDEAMPQIEGDFPLLDGATAFRPIYEPAATVMYAGGDLGELVQCNRTPNAYRRLIAGEVDLIFVAAPSEQQVNEARAQGLELVLTPVAREAFVFLVNKHNVVQALSVEDIRGVYSGAVDNWRDVGGRDAVIRAFQRPAGSGSQSTMENVVMQGVAMRTPLREEFVQGMSGIVMGVASYRNGLDALGYSFRYYATQMVHDDEVRLLLVDGVEPTVEHIRSGRYPLTVDIYMVTARPVSEHTQSVMDWFLSAAGQQWVADVGYVPVGYVDFASLQEQAQEQMAGE